jgi:hypothetical protein
VDRPFSLTHGGPTYKLGLALTRGNWVRLTLVIVGVTWVPVVVLSIVEWSATGSLPTLFVSYSMHAKLLVALPVLIAAESVLSMRTGRCIERIVDERWAEPPSAVPPLIARAERRRDSGVAEAVLFALAVLSSQALAWGILQPLGIVRGRDLARPSAAGVWNGVVALSIYQFLLYRWLWRWWIWCKLLWGLSRLRLRVLPAHPDRQGGMGFLAEPTSGFGFVIFAVCAVQASVWADKVSFAHVGALSFRNEMAVLLVSMLLIALGPLAPFMRPLWRARFEAIRQYGRLASDYVRLFHARWIDRGEREDLLGTADVQSLADIGTAYEVVREMRPIPFGLRTVIAIVTAVVVPMIPLVLMEVPFLELLRRLSGVAVGGIPH